MESLGNDDVSLHNACKYLVGNDCDVTMTEIMIREMYYGHLACLHQISIQIVSFSLLLFNYFIF